LHLLPCATRLAILKYRGLFFKKTKTILVDLGDFGQIPGPSSVLAAA
jgi:hypothetical protein